MSLGANIKYKAELNKETDGVFHQDFLLSNKQAQELYHDFAKSMPIIDYHNHLSPELISVDHEFSNVTELWLEGDHYKWRAMRANGIDEKYITGNASSEDKFAKWAETVPKTLRNPLFHWTHLELQNPFGIKSYLNPDNAKYVYESCNDQLKNGLSVRSMLDGFNVKALCTTDDPADDLRYHKSIAKSNWDVKVRPTFRPDKAMFVEKGRLYLEYLDALGKSANQEIKNFTDLIEVLKKRHDYFHENGCRLSDHGLTTMPKSRPSIKKAAEVLAKALNSLALTFDEVDIFHATVLHEVAVLNAEKGWVQQFHIGAFRNANSRMLVELGPDTGFDSISDEQQISGLARVLDELNMKHKLAKTIVYNLNPSYNDSFATMIGNFNDGQVVGKMQYGAAWWFLDQKKGMEEQLDTLSNMGLLSRFVGMLTDSRSFVSFSRHEYFRRILCDVLGKEMANGELPNDSQWVGSMIQDICYNNANNYFGL